VPKIRHIQPERRSLRTGGGVVGILLLTVGLGVSSASAAPARQSFVTMLSDTGDYIGGGVPRFYFDGNASITLSGNSGYLTVSVSGGNLGDSFGMDFAAPPGEYLHPGLYTNAQRAPFREFGHPGIDISGDGRGCNEDGGRFDVKDIRTGANHQVQALWLTYEQHCENGTAALFGEVQYHMPATTRALLPMSGYLWWPDIALGDSGSSVPVSLANVSTGSVTVSATSIIGLHAGDFDVELDQCSGETLSPGEVCQVYVRFAPSVGGPRLARFVALDSNGLRYATYLDGAGISGSTRWWMVSDPGDYIGQGLTYKYDPSNANISISGDTNVVHMALSGNGGDWWYADFAAPPGEILAPGAYLNAARYPFQGSSPGLSVSGNGRGCNTLTGKFLVTTVKYDLDQVPIYFGVKFEQHCEGADPALRGILEYHVPKGDTTPPGQASALTVTRQGGSAMVSWTNPTDPDYAFTVVRYLEATDAPGVPNGSLFGYAGPGTSVKLTGLTSVRPLAVAVWTVDTSGNAGDPVVSISP
jgi:hypothetical protein